MKMLSAAVLALFAATPVAYPDDTHRVVNQQFDSTVRPWMAVIAYLLSDGRFFLQ